MKADHLSYSRAASVCLLGLLLQVVMGLALLIYAIIGRDASAFTAACMIMCGAVVWVGLAIVFDQHRRERIEAMEAETLSAAGGRSASVFEQNPEDLRVAGRRLAWMHRILLPVVSVFLSGGYIGIGIWRLMDAKPLLDSDKFAAPQHRGWAVAIGLALAVIGFIFARFVSGMAKQPVWANLRGGAAAAVGAAVMGLAIALAHFINIAGSDIILRYLQVVVPAVMIFLGAEILFNLLLHLYRPRRAGEVPRPALDSRVLAFIASPDRLAESIGGAISYQFGVDVTGSWAYRLLSRSVLLLVLVGAGVIWLLTSLEIVEPNQRAIRVRNGVKVGEVGPGLYFKLPWPFEQLDTIETTVIRTQQLATAQAKNQGPMLWTNDHAVEEVFAIVRPSTAVTGSGSKSGSTSEISLLAVEIPIRYKISDLEKYEQFATPTTREGYIKAIAQREALAYLSTRNEDDVLGRQIPEISADLRKHIQARLDALNSGVMVISAAVEGAHPTKEAAKDFEAVVESMQKRAGKIEQGRTEAIKILTAAVGSLDLARSIATEIDSLNAISDTQEKEKAEQAAKVEAMILKAGGAAGSMVAQARADRWSTHMSARGRAEAFGGQTAAYHAAPTLYMAGHYFQALQEMMQGARVYITSDDARHNLRTILDLKDIDTSGNVFTSPLGEQNR